MQDIIFKELEKRCQLYNIEQNEMFCASSIADMLHISRNTASQHLNDLVKKGIVVKVNTRPVYFYTKKSLEKLAGDAIHKNMIQSLNEILPQQGKYIHSFDKLIGSDESLQTVVEQCKAAISYPENGLPLLIHGATGTGKSMIASLLYSFAIEQEIIQKDSPFVSVNCSEFANNPELLTSNLFGYVKGAYTDATENNDGLIAAANGGVLFLDEVHCLPGECQEKLFFFMDKGIYHQLGDNKNWHSSKCRVIFATTENPQDVLLKTLLRRIPIMVDVPSLQERPLLEKRKLLYALFNDESKQLQLNVEISNIVYQILMDYTFPGNVGGMKNAIKASCASAFLNEEKNDANLKIYMRDLPDYILKTFPSMQLKSANEEGAMISLSKLKSNEQSKSMLVQLYQKMIARLKEFESEHDGFLKFVEAEKNIIQNYTEYLLYKNRYSKKISDDYLLKILDKIYSIVINKYSIEISNTEINMYANMISDYAKYVIDAKMWVSSNSKNVETMASLLKDHAPREYVIAQEIVDNIMLNLDVELDLLMQVVLTISFISLERIPHSSTVAVILCHGYSTASSIATACNRMLGEYIFDGIDMELTVSTDKIVKQLDEFLKRKIGFNELLLLVDMGSLEDIHKRLSPIRDCNITIINNVNTKLALEIGNIIKNETPLIPSLEQIEDNFRISTKYIGAKQRPKAIITICATGFGSAKKIGELLIESIPKKVPIVIIPYDYQSLIENKEQDPIFMKYDVVLLVGTINPNINQYSFIPVENLVMNDNIDELDMFVENYLSVQEMKEFRTTMMKNFTLLNIVNHLTILNAEKLLDEVEAIVLDLEKALHIELDMVSKAGLYVHLSCMVERLILRNEVAHMDGIDELVENNQKFMKAAKEAFSVIENQYSVAIPDAEIMLVHNYFK